MTERLEQEGAKVSLLAKIQVRQEADVERASRRLSLEWPVVTPDPVLGHTSYSYSLNGDSLDLMF